ncbi:urea transporter 1-like isoform X3 [Frieseomelitta varia]|uniref:urea transporter 1-like isoform X3 n=1 Tax=Frieseomelitta varia TaxID=561572 RepID=UPI001CB69D2A|nr:urea transporter 1-like isoform X3 [Frieseomelitta varia]
MTMRDQLKESTRHDYSRAVFTGTFTVWQEFLLEKESVFWSTVRLFDSLLRGFSQVVLANNPISGLLLTISLGVSAPNTLLFSAITGFLGLLLSVLIRDSQENIANGLTVFNPLLVGAVSSSLIPSVYGPFDSFSILLTILGTIFSVYLARSLRNNKLPFIAWPFNLTEFALLLVLYTRDNGHDTTQKLQPVMRMDNATSDATIGDVSFIGENATGVHIDWGMMFHGVIVSASQVLAVESVFIGAVVYLACLLYSPITAGFAFLGALVGSLAGLMLDVQIDEIYTGLWGYNTFLTGASLGGNFFVLNGQTAAATIVAIVYTVIVQYAILFFFRNLKLPILTLPFVLVTSLFLKLRSNPGDKTFPQPPPISFSRTQHRDYITSQQAQLIQQSELKIDMHYDGAIVIGTLEISISALAEANLLLYDTEESRMVDVILLCQRLLTKAFTDMLAFYFI